MAEFEYTPFDRELRLSYLCPHCGHENSSKVPVPEPDWKSESHSSSIRTEYVDLICDNCKSKYQGTLATGINEGTGLFDELEYVDVEVTETDSKSDESEREDFEDKNTPEAILPPSDIIAFNEMRSCADIYRMYTANQIDINPDFQRGVVWKNRAQTLFVDSVLKQLPIPSICISLDGKTQKRLVIDGLQRITTMIKFLDPETKWSLANITDVDERIKGKKVSTIREVDSQLIDIFENFVIPINVIRCDYSRHDHMQYLFQIFNRLNSGGSKLYNQEIRNCIYQGSFNSLIKKLARSDRWCTFAGTTPKQVILSRFSNEERILRFFAFNGNWQNYQGRFAAFLNDYMEKYKNISLKETESFKLLFDETLDIAIKIGETKMAKVVADPVLVAISHNKQKLRDKSAEEISKRYHELMSMEEFSTASISQGLSKKDRVENRIKKAIEVFGRD